MEQLLQQILGEIRDIKKEVGDLKQGMQEVRQDMLEFKREIRSEVGKLRDHMNNRFDFLHQEMVKIREVAKYNKRDIILMNGDIQYVIDKSNQNEREIHRIWAELKTNPEETRQQAETGAI